MKHSEALELIGKYMGDTFRKDKPGYWDDNGWVSYDYKDSWQDQLMVINKIRKHYDLSIQFMNGDCNVFISKQTLDGDEILSVGGYSEPTAAVWNAIIRFVKWYNKQQL